MPPRHATPLISRQPDSHFFTPPPLLPFIAASFAAESPSAAMTAHDERRDAAACPPAITRHC
jgi:hypothetical protein